MVKRRKNNTKKKRNGKGFKANGAKARKINASTVYETCNEQLSPFGGLLPLIKFLDFVRFKEIFDSTYLAPRREPKLGHHLMFVSILMLLFISFNRLWHFTYIRLDAMLCGFFRLTKLPAATTFWRYVDSLGINQANSFVKIISTLQNGFDNFAISIITRSVSESIRPRRQFLVINKEAAKDIVPNTVVKRHCAILCFIDETREYLIGNLRKGQTVSGKEAADFIKKIQNHLPGWGAACRFVVVRIAKKEAKKPRQAIQCVMFEDERYQYRIF
jgi:hypothetical protein